jgi:hypothetical protein
MVQTPSEQREVQLWMVGAAPACGAAYGYLPRAANSCLVVLQIDRLNALQWEKIHVDALHYHAHAAIICRIPSRFKNADCLHYLIDKQILFPN